jgi:hypothetical protein
MSLMKYLQNHAESFPEVQDISEKLTPYLPNNELTQNFHYTCPGGKVTAAMELGYIEGPNGRAVIYGDGNVHWKDH